MKNPFIRKTLAERRQATADKLAEAETQAEAAKAERLRLALAGEDTSPAERTAWELETRANTLRTAIAEFDRQIAAEDVAKAEAELATRRDDALRIVEAWHNELAGMRFHVIGAASDLTALTDRCGHSAVLDLLGPRMEGHAEGMKALVEDAFANFRQISRVLHQGDTVANELAAKILRVHAEFDHKRRRAA